MATERRFLVPVNLSLQELRNIVIQNLGADPGSPVEGQLWYNTTTHQLKYRTNSTTIVIAAGVTIDTTAGDIVASAPGDAGAAGAIGQASDAGHRHPRESTSTHTYISDFDTQVRTSRLDQMAAPTADVSLNAHKIVSLADPVSAQDAATKNYVDAAIQGLQPKGAAAAATTAALAANTYANGASGVGATLTANANGAIAAIDGYAPAVGDVILVKNEATASHNGLYTVTQLGDGTHPYILTRATNNDTAGEIAGAFVFVLNGTTNANQGWVVDSAGPYIVGTTAITWAQFTGVADITAGGGITKTGNTLSANTRGFASTITGDGATTTFNQVHNLGSTDTVVSVLDPDSTPANQSVEPDIYAADANTTRIIFGAAPANAKNYRVVTHAVIANG